MKKAKKIDVIVKIPFDLPFQEVLKMGATRFDRVIKRPELGRHC